MHIEEALNGKGIKKGRECGLAEYYGGTIEAERNV